MAPCITRRGAPSRQSRPVPRQAYGHELEHFDSCGDAKMALFDYIEVFYNQRRRHSTLGQISPAESASDDFGGLTKLSTKSDQAQYPVRPTGMSLQITRPSPTRSETLPHSAAQSGTGGPAPGPSAVVATHPRPRPVGATPLRRATHAGALLPSRASAARVSASHRLARRAAAAWRSARAPNTPDSDSCSRAGAGSRTRDTLRAPLAPAATASPRRSADSSTLLVYPPTLACRPPHESLVTRYTSLQRMAV